MSSEDLSKHSAKENLQGKPLKKQLEVKVLPNFFEPPSHENLRERKIKDTHIIKGFDPKNTTLFREYFVAIYEDTPDLFAIWDINTGKELHLDYYVDDSWKKYTEKLNKKEKEKNEKKKKKKKKEEDVEVEKENVNAPGVHITPAGNIAIVPSPVGSGFASFIEPFDANGKLKAPKDWIISRSEQPDTFLSVLKSRSIDLQEGLEKGWGYSDVKMDGVYELFINGGNNLEVAVDSLRDNTDNVYRMRNIVNECYYIHPENEKLITALTSPHEITIIDPNQEGDNPNTWVKKVILPESVTWARVDGYLHTAVVQNEEGYIKIYDISTPENPTAIYQTDTSYQFQFELTNNGDILARNEKGHFEKIQTNINLITPPDENGHVRDAVSRLGALLRQDDLGRTVTYAKATRKKVEQPQKPTKTAFERLGEQLLRRLQQEETKITQDIQGIKALESWLENASTQIEQVMIKEGLSGRYVAERKAKLMHTAYARVLKLHEYYRSDEILSAIKIHQQNLGKSMANVNTILDYKRDMLLFEEEWQRFSPETKAGKDKIFEETKKTVESILKKSLENNESQFYAVVQQQLIHIEQFIKKIKKKEDLRTFLGSDLKKTLDNLLTNGFFFTYLPEGHELKPAAVEKKIQTWLDEQRTDLEAKELREKELSEQEINAMVQFTAEIFKTLLLNTIRPEDLTDIEIHSAPNYQKVTSMLEKIAIKSPEKATALREKLEEWRLRKINQLEKKEFAEVVTSTGQLSYFRNSKRLYFDPESADIDYPKWNIDYKEYTEGKSVVYFKRNTDNLRQEIDHSAIVRSREGFVIENKTLLEFEGILEDFLKSKYEVLHAAWEIAIKVPNKNNHAKYLKQIKDETLKKEAEKLLKELNTIGSELKYDDNYFKALCCAHKKKLQEYKDKYRKREVPNVPKDFVIGGDLENILEEVGIFLDMQGFTRSGTLALSGVPGAGKSFLFSLIANRTNREVFTIQASRYDTKADVSVTIVFKDGKAMDLPSQFMQAFSTPGALLVIEESREWPEGVNKLLNNIRAGANSFTTPDGRTFERAKDLLIIEANNPGNMYREGDVITPDQTSRIDVIEFNYPTEEAMVGEFENLNIKDPYKNTRRTISGILYEKMTKGNAISQIPSEWGRFVAEEALKRVFVGKVENNKEEVRQMLTERMQKGLRFVAGKSKKEQGPVSAQMLEISIRKISYLVKNNISVAEFRDLFNHFVNGAEFQTKKFQYFNNQENKAENQHIYNAFQKIIVAMRYMEIGMRAMYEKFMSEQQGVMGTRRELERCLVHLNYLLEYEESYHHGK